MESFHGAICLHQGIGRRGSGYTFMFVPFIYDFKVIPSIYVFNVSDLDERIMKQQQEEMKRQRREKKKEKKVSAVCMQVTACCYFMPFEMKIAMTPATCGVQLITDIKWFQKELAAQHEPEDVDPDIAAMMGFGGFGSSKK
jgi:U4/U6.U5 tri-snRNP component SNU23